MIKKLSTLVAGLALICLTGCTSPQKGTAQNDVFSPIEVAVPERPAGQQDVIQLSMTHYVVADARLSKSLSAGNIHLCC